MSHLMNWEDVQNAVKAILESMNLNGSIVLPNEEPAKKEELFIELIVSETGMLPHTEFEMLWQGSVDMVVNVPAKRGTERANTVAARIKNLFLPIVSQKSGFRAGPYWVRVKEARQFPSQTKDSLFRISVRVAVDVYTTEGE